MIWLLAELKKIQTTEPVIEDGGDTVRFKTKGSGKDVIFKKTNGTWYLYNK